MRARLLPVVACFAILACSGSSSSGLEGPSPNDGGTTIHSVSADGGGDDDASVVNSVLCPHDEPGGGAGCPSVGLTCRYPSPCAAAKTAVCSPSGTWGVTVPDCARQCPARLPEGGSACTVVGLECEYEDEPRPTCRDRATCVESQGKKTWASSNAFCAPQVACPASAPKTDDACADMAAGGGGPYGAVAVCAYAGSTCACVDRYAGCGACERSDFRWRCVPPPAPPCPPIRPNLGSACATEGLSCDYGTCATGRESVGCTDGGWRKLPVKC